MTMAHGGHYTSIDGIPVILKYVIVSKAWAELFLLLQTCFNIILPLNKELKQDFCGHSLCTGCWICLTRCLTGIRERMSSSQPRYVLGQSRLIILSVK